MKNIILFLLFIVVFSKCNNIEKTASDSYADTVSDTQFHIYYFNSDTIAQKLSVKKLPKGQISFMYFLSDKINNKNIEFKGIAICDTSEDKEFETDDDDSYFSDEYHFIGNENRNCTLNIRIESDTFFRARVTRHGECFDDGSFANTTLHILRRK